MNLDQFWEIIAATQAESREQQLELFRNELQRLTPEELIEFERHYGEIFVAAYSWDLWVVVWLCQAAMLSDDGFHYFRSWLISKGRATCEAALMNPDSLVEVLADEKNPRFELFAYVPWKVWESKMGNKPMQIDITHPKEPSGGDWLRPELKNRTGSKLLNLCVVFEEMGDPEFEAIEKRFPKTWAWSVQKGIISVGPQEPRRNDLPTPQEIAATIDPKLAETDFPAYLKALADAAREAYKPRK